MSYSSHIVVGYFMFVCHLNVGDNMTNESSDLFLLLYDSNDNVVLMLCDIVVKEFVLIIYTLYMPLVLGSHGNSN